MDNLIGKDVGRYHIIEQLGEGGMAVVFKAFDTRLEREVAIKFIRLAAIPLEQTDKLLKRFDREAKRMAQFTHPNIVPVIDYGEHEGAPYLVMPCLSGGTLKDFLVKRGIKAMDYRQAVRILLPVARALEYAHDRDTIHRDIKPSNILLTDRGQPMLTDFGVAKILDLEEGQTLTGTGVGLGTPKYMAPEQWKNRVTLQTDVYALGVVLYEMVTGRVPYDAETPAGVLEKQLTEPLPHPRTINPKIPLEVDRVIFKALAKEPLDRYANMGQFAQALERLGGYEVKEPLADETAETIDLGAPIIEPGGGGMESAGEARRTQAQEDYDRGVARIKPMPTPQRHLVEPPRSKPAMAKIESVAQRKGMPVWVWGLLGAGLVLVIVLIFQNLEKPTLDRPVEEANIVAETEKKTLVPVNTVTAFDTPLAMEIGTEMVAEIEARLTQVSHPLASEGAGPTTVNEKDVMEMVYVPAGEFTMGSEDGELDEKPEHRVFLDGFWIYKTAVTNGMYARCVVRGMCTEPHIVNSNTREPYFGNRDYEDYPVIYVDWEQANSYCTWAGGRLPSEAEWEKAARGTDGRKYPWGESIDCGKANYAGKNDDNDFCVGDTQKVGSYPSGASPYGALDMAGNEWEWVNDWYNNDYYASAPEKNPSGPPSGEYRVMRGGGWSYHRYNLRTSERDFYRPDVRTYDLSFRCVVSED